MINNLLFFQFALFFVPTLLIGLLVFGSDFKLGSGWVYMAALSLMAVLHFIRRYWSKHLPVAVFRVTSLLGGAAGVWSYHAMHVGYWDEHSWQQAFLVACLAVASYLAQVWAVFRLEASALIKAIVPSLVLAVIAWSIATVYPMFVLLLVSLILLVGTFIAEPESIRPEIRVCARAGYRYRYALFLIVLDVFLVVWDYKVDAQWGGYLALSMLACLIATQLRLLNNKAISLVYVVAVLNFIAAIVFPGYVISYLHSLLAGFALGVLLRQILIKAEQVGMQDVINLWSIVLFGLAVGYGAYSNLSEAAWRAVLLLPLFLGIILAPHIRYVRKRQ